MVQKEYENAAVPRPRMQEAINGTRNLGMYAELDGMMGINLVNTKEDEWANVIKGHETY